MTKQSLKKGTADYFNWSKTHPIGDIPKDVAKEGAGENRIPFTHLANSVPVYLVFKDIIEKSKHMKASIIDVGCGTGRNISFVKDAVKKPKYTFYGIDYSTACINFARQQYKDQGVLYAQYNGDIIPYPDESFDFVVSSHVLEHIPTVDGPRFFSEISRILKKGGIAVIGTPNRKYCQDLFANNPSDKKKYRLILPHEHEYYYDELKKSISKKQFKKVQIFQTINHINRSIMIEGIDRIRPRGGLIGYAKFTLYNSLRSSSKIQDLMAKMGTEYLLKKKNISYKDFIANTYLMKDAPDDNSDNLIVVAEK